MKKEKWKYKIVSSAIGIFLSLLMLALFGGISIWLYISRNGAFLFALLLTAVMLAVLLLARFTAPSSQRF